MPFVAAKCKQCGHNMQVDESLERGYCPACGTPYVKEEIINNFNTYNTTNYRIEHADAVNYYVASEKDFVIRCGVLKQYNGASVNVIIPDGVVEIEGSGFNPEKFKGESMLLFYSLERDMHKKTNTRGFVFVNSRIEKDF